MEELDQLIEDFGVVDYTPKKLIHAQFKEAIQVYSNKQSEAALKVLKRLASPDEMGGMGVTEEMTGPAAVELRTRMAYAKAALNKLTPKE